MDGEPEPEREVTRVPTDADLVSLARELNRLGVAYVVVGGFAINRLGFVRATEDIDLLIARDLANQRSSNRPSISSPTAPFGNWVTKISPNGSSFALTTILPWI